jgi:hypothetical protein
MTKRTLALLLGIMIAAVTVAAQPKLKVIGGLKIDFGRVDRGQLATRQVTLKNIGNQKLTLGSIDVSCGCTGTVISKKELKPGDTTSLLITFNSSTFNGPVQKSLTINSNSVGAPHTVIEISAMVIVDLSFSPAWFFFKHAEVGRRSTAVIKAKNESAKNILITGFRTQLPNFVVTYPPEAIAPGATIDLMAEYTPENALTAITDGVFFTTSSQIQPEVAFYVYLNFRKLK